MLSKGYEISLEILMEKQEGTDLEIEFLRKSWNQKLLTELEEK
jgi:hypothetical protein